MEGDIMDSKTKEQIQRVRVPTSGQNIYKDECVYSFDNPVSVFFVCRYDVYL